MLGILGPQYYDISKPAWPLNDAHWRVFTYLRRACEMEYIKPFLTFEQQANLLMEDRGMIADRDDLLC